MSAPPLTHHEIVRLVEPFARLGRQVDLGASDRTSRRIVFKRRERPAELAGEPMDGPAWQEALELDCRFKGRFVLLRTIVGPGGASASLRAAGPEPGELLSRIDAVPPARHFSVGAAWIVARSYDTALPDGVRAGRDAAGLPPLVLTRAQLQVDGLTLTLDMTLPHLRSVAADLTLTPAPGPVPDFPEDLLAVQGWDWARLIRTRDGWTSKLRLRGAALRRSRTAEAALEQAGAHLSRVVAEPPEKFHDRHRLARWGVVVRRGIPTLTALFMVVGALLLPRLADGSLAGLWLALHYVPIALLAVSFSLQELPQFEIPPWPRRLRAPRWTAGPAAGPDAAR
jgi:hypothetical protein